MCGPWGVGAHECEDGEGVQAAPWGRVRPSVSQLILGLGTGACRLCAPRPTLASQACRDQGGLGCQDGVAWRVRGPDLVVLTPLPQLGASARSPAKPKLLWALAQALPPIAHLAGSQPQDTTSRRTSRTPRSGAFPFLGGGPGRRP